MDWEIQVDPGVHEETGTTALAIDVDPRRRVVGIGLRRRSGGDQALFGNVLVRRFAGVSGVDPSTAADWLHSPEAQRLLSAIADGYHAEMIWSGDWVADWSPSAVQALETLHRGILERL